MKKKFCVLILALAAYMAVSAGAYYLMDDGFSIFPNEETYRFFENNTVNIPKDKWNGVAADNWNFCSEFHDGLLLMMECVTTPPGYLGGYYDNYIDKSGNLVDLNRGRYWMLFSFNEGLAAAELERDENGEHGVAYIDTKGNEVVPANKEWTTYRVGLSSITYYAGRFENGKALVTRYRQQKIGPDERPNEWDSYGFEYAYIDTKGNYLSDWKLAKEIKTIASLPLYDQNGVWIGFRLDPAAWAANAISYEQLYKDGSEADGGTQNPTGTPPQETPFFPEYHAPELPDYNYGAPSAFASTAKVTGYHLGDLDFGTAEVTITNPTQRTDAGVVAVVFANIDNTNFAIDGDGVFFIPYELAPGESKPYFVDMCGIINQAMFTSGSKSTYAEQFSSHVASTVFTFTDDDDLWNFYETIPYEQFWYPQGSISEFQPICDSQPGTDWLKGVAGISRPDADLEPFYYTLPDGAKLNAAKADHAAYCRIK